MSDTGHAESLLRLAERDFATAAGMIEAHRRGVSRFADEAIGFHLQQAAEKAVKAWITRLGRPYPHTHDLATLLDLLRRNGRDIDLFSGLIDLNPFAVIYRYDELPDDLGDFDPPEMLSQVRQLLDHVASSTG